MSRRRMRRKFDAIYKRARRPEQIFSIDFSKDAIVIFSDHHKGDGSGADDFRTNALLYSQVLASCKERGFRLIVLGDSEECWENSYEEILARHGELVQKEVALAVTTPRGKKLRIWGNHDKEVSLRRFRRKLQKFDIPSLHGVVFKEGLCLGSDVFLIHGHQGRLFDDMAWRVSRWAVKFVWKSLQVLFLIGSEGPAKNLRVAEDLELNYYRWAKRKKLLLVCGHTHRALFASRVYSCSENDGSRTVLENESFFEPRSRRPVPCYFNTGCCCYTDGLTGLELEKGWLRLVLWRRQTGQRFVLAEERLEKILAAIKAGRPLADLLEAIDDSPAS